MAISLINKPNVNPADSDFPFGDLRDNPGDFTGTPLNRLVLSDYIQFFHKMMSEAGVSYNGELDNDYSGFQFWEALRVLFPLRQKVIEIGDWNMDSTVSIGVNHGIADFLKIRSVNVIIIPDDSSVTTSLPDTGDGRIGAITSTQIQLIRDVGSIYDSTDYDSTSFNRGFVTVGFVD